MNRSRYLPQGYSVSPYPPQSYGGIPTTAPPQSMPGMMPTQPLAMAPPNYGSISPQQGMGQSPIPNQFSPNPVWTATFQGPIIEDLIAPPMGIPSASPPINAFPPRMMPMHPGAMPQVQNVFGVRQPLPPQFAGMHMAGPMQGMHPQPTTRMMGTYPPYGVAGHHQPPPPPQQQPIGLGFHHPQQRGFDPSPVLARPTMDTGFPGAAGDAPAPGGMQQMGSPPMGGSPGGNPTMEPLTHEDGSLAGFLSPDLS